MVDKTGVFMSSNFELKTPLEPLTWVLGKWRGKGSGGFPTHDSFEYDDYMHFKIIDLAFENEPIIHFEEIARVIDENGMTFKHWETGYFKPNLDGRVEFYICHNTGRIEITYGTYLELDQDQKSFRIKFESDSIRNDEGTNIALESRREFICNKGVIIYNLAMSTLDVGELKPHLQAQLKPI